MAEKSYYHNPYFNTFDVKNENLIRNLEINGVIGKRCYLISKVKMYG